MGDGTTACIGLLINHVINSKRRRWTCHSSDLRKMRGIGGCGRDGLSYLADRMGRRLWRYAVFGGKGTRAEDGS